MKLFGRPLTRPTGRTLRSALSVLIVTTASGMLFVASARSNAETRSQTAVDLAGLVAHRQNEVKELKTGPQPERSDCRPFPQLASRAIMLANYPKFPSRVPVLR